MLRTAPFWILGRIAGVSNKRKPLINAQSYRRQIRVMYPVQIDDTLFTPKISISKSQVEVKMEWIVTGSSKLVQEVELLKYSNVLLTITMRFSMGHLRLDNFESAAAKSQKVYDAATLNEKEFIKRLGSDSLCHLLRYMVSVFNLEIDPKQTYVDVQAWGIHRKHREATPMLVQYYTNLGFSGKNLRARLSRLLSRCRNIDDLKEDDN